jgi:hypothetical protein
MNEYIFGIFRTVLRAYMTTSPNDVWGRPKLADRDEIVTSGRHTLMHRVIIADSECKLVMQNTSTAAWHGLKCKAARLG